MLWFGRERGEVLWSENILSELLEKVKAWKQHPLIG